MEMNSHSLINLMGYYFQVSAIAVICNDCKSVFHPPFVSVKLESDELNFNCRVAAIAGQFNG